MHWARGEGAAGASLQVAADDQAARALYDRLGFRTERLRDHYRREA